MSTKKRLSALLIAIVMLIASLPITALAAAKAPAKPKSLSSSVTSSSITLKWGKVSKAKGYEIYSYDSKKKKYKKLGTTTKTSYTVKKLKAATTYVYAVKSYSLNKKKKVYSGYSAKHTTSTAPGKVSGISTSGIDKTSFTVSWKAVKGASKYKVQYATDPGFTANVQNVTTTALKQKLSSLTQGTVYYVRVYSQRVANKKTYTSAASTAVSVTTKGTAPQGSNNGSGSGSGSSSGSGSGSSSSDKHAATKSAVNESVSYQTVDGFGASAAWWSQKVGGYDNADEYLKLLYSKTDGIGLNIYRYNVGGGSNDANGPIAGIDRDRGAETFLACENDPVIITDASFDWSRDANARKALALAKKYAGNDLRVSLFANSPPAQLTKNHFSYCPYNGDGFDDYWNSSFEYRFINTPQGKNENLVKENYGLYFDYLTKVADHFVSEGYNVTDVSPINEPNFFWGESGDYKCLWGESKDENGASVWEWKYVKRGGGFISERENSYVDSVPELAAQRIRYAWQEGCFYSPYSARLVLEEFAKRADRSKSYRISMYEGAAADVNENYANITSDCNGRGSFARYSSEIFKSDINRDYYKAISLHSYWAYRYTKELTGKYLNEKYPGVTVACTEYCQMNNDGSNNIVKLYPKYDENGNRPIDEWGNPATYWDFVENFHANGGVLGIIPGVQVAREIYDDMTALNATEWNWWTAVSGGSGTDALIYYNNEGDTWETKAREITTSKRLWCVGNYSRYIQSGAKRVEIKEAQKDMLSTAYKNPDGSLVIVYINQKDNNMTVNVNASGYKSYAAYETSLTKDLVCTQQGGYSYNTGISVPAQSVVTVVLNK